MSSSNVGYIRAHGTLPPPFHAGQPLRLSEYDGSELHPGQVYLFVTLGTGDRILGLTMARVVFTMDGRVGLEQGTGEVRLFDLRSDRFDVAAHLTPTGAAHADVSLLTSPSPSL